MAPREELITSAVTFLQDPSVANAPLEKRIAFLQSKNLTQPEIDASLARSGEPAPSQPSYTTPQVPARQYQQQYGYNPQQSGYWEQPPPEVPRRDWRDYFIMATVMGGVGYGLYTLAQRYVIPLIAPPTPPQLEQDKAAIDEAFSRAFDLIEQLSADTAAIKASESARQERLDTAMTELEETMQEMKNSSRRRDDDNRRIVDDVKALQDLIPKAIKAQGENNDNRMKELNAELKSLKTLVSNRMGGVSTTPTPMPTPIVATIPGANMFGSQGTVGTGVDMDELKSNTGSRSSAANAESKRTFPSYGGSRGGIPAWQLAAAKKADAGAAAASDGE